MGYKRPSHRDDYFYKREYRYDRERDCYHCPAGEVLPYRTTNRLGKRLHARRKETVWLSFTYAKELHGHRYARFRGLS